MKRAGIVFVVCMLLLGMVLVVGNENIEALVDTNDPTDNSQSGLTNPSNVYASDDSYATATLTPGTGTLHWFFGYEYEDMGTEVTKVEVGVEHYMNTTNLDISLYVSVDAGTSWSSELATTDKLADNDVVEFVDFTDYQPDGNPWSWDDLSDDNFRVRITMTCLIVHCAYFADYIPVRVTHGTAFHIQMLNPQNLDTVHNTISLVSKVTTDTEIDQVTYYISEIDRYHVATYDDDTNTYIYPEFNTRNLDNDYYTIIARANKTTGEYATKTITIRVSNSQDKGCYFDDILNVWICPQIRTFVPDRSYAFAQYETTKATTQTYWEAFYWYSDSSADATSHAMYEVVDSDDYTDNTIIHDWVWIDDYDPSNRVYVNATADTQDTSDDTELENDTYQSFFNLDGSNVTINCTVTTDVERIAYVFIAESFDWNFNTATEQYTYSWSFTNNLQGTIDTLAVQIPFEVDAEPSSVEVWDVTGNVQLDAQKDYGVSMSSVEVGILSLTASSTKQITITFSPFVQGTDILKPTITILEGDIETAPVIRNAHTYNRAYKSVYNSNNFDYSGIMIVHWQTTSRPSFNSLIVEDSDGSVYEWYIEQGQVIVKDVNIDRHENKGFYFYFDTVSEPIPGFNLLVLLAPLIIIILYIISAFVAIAISNKDMEASRISYYKNIGYGSFFIATLFVLVIICLEIFGSGFF